jgi:hypothetical protein
MAVLPTSGGLSIVTAVARIGDRYVALGVEYTDELPTFGPAPPHQARRNHFGVVEHHHIAGPEQRRQVFLHGGPQHVAVDVEVVVHEPVTHARSGRPRHVRVLVARGVADLLGCLANDLHQLVSARRNSSSVSRSLRVRCSA